MRYLKFKLSMPSNNSWNGKWTGDGVEYNAVRRFTKADDAHVDEILSKGYFHYNFGDGWAAGIDVTEVDIKGKAKAKKMSKGFCGYEWMIDSIVLEKKIAA